MTFYKLKSCERQKVENFPTTKKSSNQIKRNSCDLKSTYGTQVIKAFTGSQK